MKVFVNGKEVHTQASTLEQLIGELDLPAQGVAAAVDNRIVKRASWAEHALAEGAKVTVIKAVCGG